MSIQCMRKANCEWPDCNCSDSVKKGRWNVSCKTCEGKGYVVVSGNGPSDEQEACPECNTPQSYGEVLTTPEQARMHADADYERADPGRMQAVLNEHFGPALAAKPQPTFTFDKWRPGVGLATNEAKRVIPIQAIDVAAEEAPKFDADVLAIMLREAGATVDPDGCFYVECPALRKLAEALNNL